MQLQKAEPTQIRVALADRYVLTRQCLQRLLDNQPEFSVVGQASTARKTLALITHLGPDVLVLGELADTGVLAFLERLNAAECHVRPVLLVSNGMSRGDFGKAVTLGAWGIVPRNSEIATLLQCLSCVMAGARFVDQNAAERQDAAPDPDPAVRTLTERERELAIAVAGGISNREIAEKFSITENTVKRRLFDVFSKLGVRSRLQLAIFALQNGLLPEEAENAPARICEPVKHNRFWIAAEGEAGAATAK